MSRSRNTLSGVYVLLAFVALIACWRQNLLFAEAEGINVAGAFTAFWPALLANHATTSIGIDIFLFALAANTWMVVEARRLEVRFVWLYVILGILIAISFTFPLFLVARERRLHALKEPRSEMGPTRPDIVALGLLGVPIVIGAIWTMFW